MKWDACLDVCHHCATHRYFLQSWFSCVFDIIKLAKQRSTSWPLQELCLIPTNHLKEPQRLLSDKIWRQKYVLFVGTKKPQNNHNRYFSSWIAYYPQKNGVGFLCLYWMLIHIFLCLYSMFLLKAFFTQRPPSRPEESTGSISIHFNELWIRLCEPFHYRRTSLRPPVHLDWRITKPATFSCPSQELKEATEIADFCSCCCCSLFFFLTLCDLETGRKGGANQAPLECCTSYLARRW